MILNSAVTSVFLIPILLSSPIIFASLAIYGSNHIWSFAPTRNIKEIRQDPRGCAKKQVHQPTCRERASKTAMTLKELELLKQLSEENKQLSEENKSTQKMLSEIRTMLSQFIKNIEVGYRG